jgi:threonine dehydrogenase-like Zn-dependent dehydrogenase
MGAEPIDASSGGAVAEVLERTHGRGAQAVIEAVGVDQTVTDAVLCAAPGATVSVIGVNLNMAFPFPMPIALVKRLTFRVTYVSVPTTWRSLVPLVAAGHLHPENVITHRLALSEAPQAYRMFEAREDGVSKIVLDPAR